MISSARIEIGIDAVLLREVKVSLHTGEANDLISLLDGLRCPGRPASL